MTGTKLLPATNAVPTCHCLHCRKAFVPSAPRDEYCSDNCRDAYMGNDGAIDFDAMMWDLWAERRAERSIDWGIEVLG